MALNEPRTVEVRVDERGVPLTVMVPRAREGGRSGRRPGARGDRRTGRTAARPVSVEAVRESWRIDDEWWRRPVRRLYHSLVLDGGALVTVYHDLEDGRWYLHG